MSISRTNNFKILFVYPNTMMATLVPIHISILSACLKEKGFQVDLFDTTYYKTEEVSFEQKKVELLQIKPFNFGAKGVEFKTSDMCQDFRNKVLDFQPDLIAVSIVEDTFALALSLLRSIKDIDIPVIAGGVFVTFSPDEVISNENIDMICVGEGEEALVEVCEKMSRHESVAPLRNIWIKQNGNIIRNPLRGLTDINKIPFINYDIFERSRLYRPMYGKIHVMAHIELDRGCPYGCTYCEAPQLREIYKDEGYGHYYRRKNIDQLMDEMMYVKKRYHPDYVNFNSETFLAKPLEELKEFAKRYRCIGLPFWCQTRPETVTDEKIHILKEMGCQNLQFGIEHGNEEFRRRMLNRRCSNETIVKALRTVEKYQIRYTVNNIIGFPDETRELVFDTININREINPATMNCYFFTPYKGVTLYRYCIEKGYLDKDTKVHQLLDGAKLKMDSISYAELKGLQRTFSLYAKMPKEEWPKIRLAERFDDEGNRVFNELRSIYYEQYFK